MLDTERRQINVHKAFRYFNRGKYHTAHRLNSIQKLGLIDNTGNLVFLRAKSYRELRTAYSLSYRIFLMNRYIQPHFLGMRIREWETSPDMATFIERSADGMAVRGRARRAQENFRKNNGSMQRGDGYPLPEYVDFKRALPAHAGAFMARRRRQGNRRRQ